MSRQLRIAYPGAYYHVTSRGNERKNIFKTQGDKVKFLDYLSSATQRYGAVIHVYCLMDNHYHLLLETPEGNLSQIMRHINGAYTTYFNIRHNRCGHLFQGRFKAILVEADAYAAELSRYIHLNPVRAGIVQHPEDYQWSSYGAYIDQDQSVEWLRSDFILGYFGERDAINKYRNYVEKLIDIEYESPLQNVIGSTILGTDAFIMRITGKHIETNTPQRDIPAIRQLATRPTPEKIINAVNTCFKSDKKLARQAGMFLCHRYSGAKLQDIAEHFSVGSSAISEASRRFIKLMEDNETLSERIETIMKKLNF